MINNVAQYVFSIEELACKISTFLPCKDAIQLSMINNTALKFVDGFVKISKEEFAKFFSRVVSKKDIPVDTFKANRFATLISKTVVHVALSHASITEDKIQRKSSYFPNLLSLEFYKCKFLSPPKMVIPKFKNITSLKISLCSRMRDDLEWISLCSKLTDLTIISKFSHKIEGAFFKDLSPSVTALRCINCNIDDRNLPFLTRLVNLLTIDFSKNFTTYFSPLPTTVTSLKLKGCFLNDKELRNISRLTNLRELDISYNLLLKGFFFNHLPTTLTSLSITSCGLEDNAFRRISRLTNLQELDISNNKLTGAFFNHLPLSLIKLNMKYGGVTKPPDVYFIGISHLTNLKDLAISKYPSLKKLSPESLAAAGLQEKDIPSCRFM